MEDQDKTSNREVVCHSGDNAGHMRRVLPNRDKATGIDRSGNKGQITREVAIRGFRAFAAGEPA